MSDQEQETAWRVQYAGGNKEEVIYADDLVVYREARCMALNDARGLPVAAYPFEAVKGIYKLSPDVRTGAT